MYIKDDNLTNLETSIITLAKELGISLEATYGILQFLKGRETKQKRMIGWLLMLLRNNKTTNDQEALEKLAEIIAS